MPSYRFVESAAATAVGSLMNNGQRGQAGSGRARRVNAIRVGGSAAAGDCAVDLFYGDTYIGRFFSTIAGAVGAVFFDRSIANQIPDQNYIMEPGEFLNLYIADAGGTNVIQVECDVEEL